MLLLSSSTTSSREKNYQFSFPIENQITSTINKQQYNSLFKQGNSYYNNKNYNAAIEKHIQSLKFLSQDNKAEQEQTGKTYIKIAKSYEQLKDREKTAYFYKKAFDSFTVINNKKLMARTLKNLAESERHLNNLMLALEYSIQSLSIYETLDEPEEYAKALMSIGIIYRYINRYEKSLIHIREAYDIYKKIKNHNGIAKTSNEMGNLYIRLEQFKQAKYFFQETINTPEDKLEIKTIASALKQMAVIEFKSEHYQSAMDYAQRAYKIYQLENEQLKECAAARIIANIYRAQKDNINAIDYYQRSLNIAIKNNNPKLHIEAKIPLAHMFLIKDTNKAVNLLLSALEIAIKIKDDKQIFHAYNKLRMAEEYRSNFKKALFYAKKEISLSNIIQKKSEKRKVTLAKAALHSHHLEIELESLREKSKLDQLELTKKNNEIEIGEQAQRINELELTKNKYASIALSFLLVLSVFLVFFIYRNFIVSKKRNKELHYLASRDALTNCYNRRSLFQAMNGYFANTEVNDNYSIIMVDIDYFKNVNDSYGHNTGDSVICHFASILQNNIRQNDIVARLGGEEFCIILHHASQQEALVIAENLREKVEHTMFDNIAITSSFGITSLKFGAKTPTELIKQADIALYKSKSLGRNRVTLWDKSLGDYPERRAT